MPLNKETKETKPLPSVRNQDWKKDKVEMEKVNKLLKNIPLNSMTKQRPYSRVSQRFPFQ